MADTLLIDLFKDVGSFVVQLAKEEINLLGGVDEEVQKLQDKLGFVRAMLDDAEERHAVKQRTEKLWLEQLQNQYYEMDDILDTWNTARIRAQIEKEEGKPAYIQAFAVVKKKLPFLEVLDSWSLGNVKKVGDEFLGIEDSKNKKECDVIFPNLKSLQFNWMPNWEEWVVTTPIKTKIMPRLQSLSILICHELKSLPDYVLAAPLKKLKISSSTLLEESLQREIRHNGPRISHIPNIKLDGKYVQRDGKPQNQFTD